MKVRRSKEAFSIGMRYTFSKMARTFLRHIRVTSVGELKARITMGINEMNAAPVVFRWKKFDLEVA